MPRKSERDTFVYLIGNVTGSPVKIGVAYDVKKRLSSLQSGCPDPLKIAAAFCFPYKFMAHQVERCFCFSYSSQRLAGEWFHMPVSEAVFRLSLQISMMVDAMTSFPPEDKAALLALIRERGEAAIG